MPKCSLHEVLRRHVRAGQVRVRSLRRRGDDNWELRVSAGRDPLTRRYQQRTHLFRGAGKKARKALAAFVAEVESGSGRGTIATVAELMETWCAFSADRVAPTTLQDYRLKARYRIIPELGNVPLRKLPARDLERWYGRLLREEGLAPSHVHQIPRHHPQRPGPSRALRVAAGKPLPCRPGLPAYRSGKFARPTSLR